MKIFDKIDDFKASVRTETFRKRFFIVVGVVLYFTIMHLISKLIWYLDTLKDVKIF